MRPSSPRSSRISSTTARYSRASSCVCSSSGWPSWTSCTSMRRELVAVLAGVAGAGEPAMQADHGRDRVAAARDAALDHLGDDADTAELAVATGKQEDAILLADVDRQGRGDAGEDDCIVKWDQAIGHSPSPISVVSLNRIARRAIGFPGSQLRLVLHRPNCSR